MHPLILKTHKHPAVSFAVAATLILLALLSGSPLSGAVLSGQHLAFLPIQDPLLLPLPRLSQSQTKLAAGKFLVASRSLSDPNFAETVILLIEYDWHGAMGVIINRPTDVKLSTVLPEIKELQQRTDTVHLGGPVAPGQMLLLIRAGSQPAEARHVVNDIYVSGSRAVLRQVSANGRGKFRVYAGYAGWGSGQLDREMMRGDWHVAQVEAEIVFDKAPTEVWPELIRRSSMQWARAQKPEG